VSYNNVFYNNMSYNNLSYNNLSYNVSYNNVSTYFISGCSGAKLVLSSFNILYMVRYCQLDIAI